MCGSSQLTQFLSLGDQPLANRFITKEELHLPEPRYPLDIYFCEGCYLAQLIDVVDKEELFRNYIYFSSGMPKLSNHFKQYADDVRERFLALGDSVVELASNDGILLKHFQDCGHRVLGIDPATNIAAVAQSRGVSTINDFFSESLAGRIVQEHGRARVVIANNVVAHINNHHDLMRGIATLIANDGVFVMEAPYLVDMFENLTYDTIYHEHLSYLAVRPLQALAERFGLEVFEAQLHPVQGQSVRVFMDKRGVRPVHESVALFLEKEKKWQLENSASYYALAGRVRHSKDRLVARLKELKGRGKRIAAYGAPAKGNTVLNYCHIGPDIIEYALEDLSSKHGLYTPGTHIPVVSRQEAEKNPPDYYLLLAWNYFEPIRAKEKEFKKRGGKFIIPIGDDIKEI